MSIKKKKNLVTGPAISDTKGFLLATRDLNTLLYEILLEIHEESSNMFPPTIESADDIIDNYKVYRTFRKTSDTRALKEKVAVADIEIVNRWDQVSLQHSKRIAQPMRHHYVQFELLLKPFLRYTYEM